MLPQAMDQRATAKQVRAASGPARHAQPNREPPILTVNANMDRILGSLARGNLERGAQAIPEDGQWAGGICMRGCPAPSMLPHFPADAGHRVSNVCVVFGSLENAVHSAHLCQKGGSNVDTGPCLGCGSLT